MSQAVLKLTPAPQPAAPQPAAPFFLGPGRVIELAGATPIVELPDGATRRAEMALAFPYAPASGDTLLVIATADACYCIGVLRAGGEVALRFIGDVSLHAIGGSLRLGADQEVTIAAPKTELRTGKLQVLAESVVQKCESLLQRVRGTLKLHAGDRVELCDGDWHSRAERMSVATRGVVTINGEQVHLG